MSWSVELLAIELQENVKRVTAPYKYPREIEFVDTLLRFYPLFGKASVAYPGTFSRSQANRQQGDDVLSCSIFWQRFGSV